MVSLLHVFTYVVMRYHVTSNLGVMTWIRTTIDSNIVYFHVLVLKKYECYKLFKRIHGNAYIIVATPLWGKCEVATHTPENGTWKSSGTPENLEFDCRDQNTSPWGVLYIIGKVLKYRCPKWPCMSHLDICSTSYGRKKGRESNWQSDSRPLKVGNRPDPSVRRWSATHRWKSIEESYKFASDLVPIGGLSWELWAFEVPGVQTRTVSGVHFGGPGKKKPFGCRCDGVTQRILYGRRWWLPPSLGRGESSESVLPVACPNTKGVFEGELTHLWLVLM